MDPVYHLDRPVPTLTWISRGWSRFQVVPSTTQIYKADWRNFWRARLHNRHKILIWKILVHSLPTNAKLSFISILIRLCPICGLEEENSVNLFLKCLFIAVSWFHLERKFCLEPFVNNDIYKWIGNLLNMDNCFTLSSIIVDKCMFLNFAAVAIELPLAFEELTF